MRIRLLGLLLCAVAGFLSLAINESVASNVSWSISVFEGPLRQHGRWIERTGYGRCWYPAYVASDWRPYDDGYWVWTDYGWYWVSEEPWAWATYHYGRWINDSYYGWVWVPDTEWGPSWVCWREGGGYVGWAPLSPACRFGPDGYMIVRERDVPSWSFVFVESNHFGERIHRRTVIVNNTTIINKTVNVTKINRVKNVVVNNGPKVDGLQKVSSRKLTMPLTRGSERPDVAPPRQQPSPKTLKPAPVEPVSPPKNEEKAKKREPEVIRPRVNAPEQPAGATSEPEKKPVKPRVEPRPTETPLPPVVSSESLQKDKANPRGASRSYQNFGLRGPGANVSVAPESVQPRQRTVREPSPQSRPSSRDERGTGQSRSKEDEDTKQ